ncbi:hypothetical protein DFJ73DRAFT_765180 [Zopfochytrium polystomum]|nr:hypothetical protein DFJ73DRAFT_765180 [Zopfochytrium polystomum]
MRAISNRTRASLLLAVAAAAHAVAAQTLLTAAANATTGFPDGFSINTTASVQLATQYLFSNPARPYYKLDPPYISPSTGEVIDADASTTIAVELDVNRIYGVEPKSSSFILDMMVTLYWVDPRLAFQNPNLALEVDPSLPWTPVISFSKLAIDTANVPNPIFEDLYIFSDGSGGVLWIRQLVLPFSSKYNLHGFPYDNQTLSVSLTLGKGDSGRLFLTLVDADFMADSFSSLWTLTNNQSTVNKAGEATFSFEISRVPSSYITRYILPMAILSLVSCTTYFVEPSAFPPRFTGMVALMLSVVTLNVVVAQELPKVRYLTTMDAFIITTFLYVFFSLVASTLCYALHTWKYTVASAALQAFLRVTVTVSVAAQLWACVCDEQEVVFDICRAVRGGAGAGGASGRWAGVFGGVEAENEAVGPVKKVKKETSARTSKQTDERSE